MRVIDVDPTTPEKLLSSNVPEPDLASGEVEWVGGSYSDGDVVVVSSTHRKYQAATDTSDSPITGVRKTPPSWIDIGSTNRFAMFGDVVSEPTTGENVTVQLRHGSLVDSMSGFNIKDVGSIDITVESDLYGVVFDETVELRRLDDIDGWFDYFFMPISERDSFSIQDLPPFDDATITVKFNGSSSSVGLLKLGYGYDIAQAEFGTSLQLIDYSRTPDGEFGLSPDKIVRRRSARLGRFKISMPTDSVGEVTSQLAGFTGKPCVWIGSDKYPDATSIYGIYRDFSVTLSYPTISRATLEILGLT